MNVTSISAEEQGDSLTLQVSHDVSVLEFSNELTAPLCQKAVSLIVSHGVLRYWVVCKQVTWGSGHHSLF